MYPPSGTYNDSYQKDMAVVRTKTQWVLVIVFLVLLFAFPTLPFVGGYLIKVVSDIAIVVIAVMGINLLTGYCGQITIGQSAFAMLGGYVSAVLTTELGFSFWIGVPCGGIAAAIIGLFFGLPSLRVKGLYLALTTLAAFFVITWTVRYVPQMVGQPWGVTGVQAPPPKLGGMVFTGTSYYYIAMTFAVAMTLFAKGIARSGLGRAFVAVRDNDNFAEAIGINIFYYKLVAFAICSFYAGVAGALSAHYVGWIGVESFTLMDSVWWIGMAIIGGLGSITGSLLGVLFLSSLKQLVLIWGPGLIGEYLPMMAIGAAGGLLTVIFGLAILLFLIFEPRGLYHRWEIVKASYRLWPFAY